MGGKVPEVYGPSGDNPEREGGIAPCPLLLQCNEHGWDARKLKLRTSPQIPCRVELSETELPKSASGKILKGILRDASGLIKNGS